MAEHGIRTEARMEKENGGLFARRFLCTCMGEIRDLFTRIRTVVKACLPCGYSGICKDIVEAFL